MDQTTELIQKLGQGGLIERLDEDTKNQGLSEHQTLINLLKEKIECDTNLYNAVGAIYPLLGKIDKHKAIRAHLNQFRTLNYLTVSFFYTPCIREPLLLADIAVNCSLYWPGLMDQDYLRSEKKSFTKLEKEIMDKNGLFNPKKVNSDFLAAYALMRKDFTSFGDDYVKAANPQFLERVLKGIVALRFAKVSKEEIDNERNRLYQLLPKSVHDKIETLIEKADWIDSNLSYNL